MPFLIVIAIAIALVWGIVALRFGGPLAVGGLTLLSGICFGAFFFQVSLITFDRILVGVLIALYLLLRKSSLFEPKSLSMWDAWGLLFLLILVVSTLTHDWRWEEMKPVSRLVFYYLLPAVMYWIGRQSRLPDTDLRYLFLGTSIFGLYLAITAVAEWQQVYGVVYPKYIVGGEYSEFFGRGRGPLLNPSGNGILMCLGLACLLLQWSRCRFVGRIAIAGGSIVYGMGIVATLTRCVWLGAALGVLVLVWVTFPKRARNVVVTSAFVLGSLFVAASWHNLTQFKRDKDVSPTEMAKSAKIRPVLAYIAWEMFQDRPVFGVGFGHYKEFDRYYIERNARQLNLELGRPYHQHNIVLSLLTETGYVGAQAFVILLIVWTRAGWQLARARAAPLVVRHLGVVFLVLMTAYLTNGMFQDVTIVPMVHMTLCFFAGLTIGQLLKFSESYATSYQSSWNRFTSLNRVNRLAGRSS